jgi:hypothetical protein
VSLLSVGAQAIGVNKDAPFCNNLLPVSLSYPLQFEFLVREHLRETAVSLGMDRTLPNHPSSVVLCG